MRLSERIADTIDDTDTALWIADEIWAMEDEIDAGDCQLMGFRKLLAEYLDHVAEQLREKAEEDV